MGTKQIAILYHGGCPDGFGGAFSAYKKYGDSADYIPVKHGKPIPENLDGKDIYLIDFCYNAENMELLAKVAKSLTVLDHHEGIRAVATKYAGVFDTKHSGATIAWTYFHPNTPTPALLKYVEDGDLYQFKLEDSRAVLAYVYTLSDSLSSFTEKNVELWNTFFVDLENSEKLTEVKEKGKMFLQYHEHVIEHGIHHADLVRFEGYECYLSAATGEFKSDLGNKLARIKPPLALILSIDAEVIRVSLRSDGTVNVAEIAQKYGGNGHPAAASFALPLGSPVPWTVVNEHENPRH